LAGAEGEFYAVRETLSFSCCCNPSLSLSTMEMVVVEGFPSRPGLESLKA